MSKRKAVPMHPATNNLPNLLGTATLRAFRLEREGKQEGCTIEITNDAGYEGNPTIFVRWDFVDDTMTLFIKDSGHTRKVDQWNTKTASLPALRTTTPRRTARKKRLVR